MGIQTRENKISWILGTKNLLDFVFFPFPKFQVPNRTSTEVEKITSVLESLTQISFPVLHI